MTTRSADKKPKVVAPHTFASENEKQAAERRRLEDALEDDEVLEALTSFRSGSQAKNKAG